MKTIEHIRNFILNGLLGLLLLTIVQYAYISYQDSSKYFEYYRVEPLQKELLIGEDLWFLSDSIIHEKLDLYWEDSLYCDMDSNGTYEIFSTYLSSKTDSQPTDNEELKPWRYDSATPKKEVECYLRSNTSTRVEYNIKKSQTILSGPVKFIK